MRTWSTKYVTGGPSEGLKISTSAKATAALQSDSAASERHLGAGLAVGDEGVAVAHDYYLRAGEGYAEVSWRGVGVWVGVWLYALYPTLRGQEPL